VCCLNLIAYDGLRIVLDVFVVSIRSCGDGEGVTPRCRVGVGRLDEADEVVGAIVIIVELMKERDVIVRWLTRDASEVIRRECKDSCDFVRRHRGGAARASGGCHDGFVPS
jgi:hypothetical protein